MGKVDDSLLKQLRIGNYVKMSGKIVKMDVRLFHAAIHGFEGYEPEPIELKGDEWLIKFGFKKVNRRTEDKPLIQYEDSFSMSHEFDKNGVFGYCIGVHDWKEIPHVHKLQNIFYELNDKEIDE